MEKENIKEEQKRSRKDLLKYPHKIPNECQLISTKFSFTTVARHNEKRLERTIVGGVPA